MVHLELCKGLRSLDIGMGIASRKGGIVGGNCWRGQLVEGQLVEGVTI